MIDFKTWLLQIMGYCEFVVDDVALRQAWVNRDFSETSVTNFDELYEQVFDDLDADRFAVNLATYMPNAAPARTAVAAFLTSLKEMDQTRSENPELLNSSVLLDSGQWQRVRSSALIALEFFDPKLGDWEQRQMSKI